MFDNLKVFKMVLPLMENFTPYLSTYNRSPAIVEEMGNILEERGMVKSYHNFYTPILHAAVRSNDSEMLQKYLPFYDKVHCSLLTLAAKTNNVELMKYFISKGEDGYLGIGYVLFDKSHTEASEYLLSLDVSKNIVENFLCDACLRGNLY
jgi:hypothetical protein